MHGLGKNRSKLGTWLDERGIKQQWLAEASGVGRSTISKACSEDTYIPNGNNIKKMIEALRKIDPAVSSNDFWGI